MLNVQRLDQMGSFHISLDEMRLDKVGMHPAKCGTPTGGVRLGRSALVSGMVDTNV